VAARPRVRVWRVVVERSVLELEVARLPPAERNLASLALLAQPACSGGSIGLYKILLITILYGIQHTNARSEGESYTAQLSCNRIVLGSAMQVGGGMNGWLIRAQQPRSQRISCIGQWGKHFGDAHKERDAYTQ